MTTGTELPARVRDTIRRHGLIHGGETVLAAVSGGADSGALFHVLHELRSEIGFALSCAHVHHGLRPEADADAAFVERLAAELGVPFRLLHVTVRRGPPWDGLEAEARRARHAALEAHARRLSATRIATGHTADDQAETVMMRLLEGAGPRGLGAIAPARGVFIRPLLDITRSDVLGYLRARGLAWIEDASNADLRFKRNRLRHEVMPALVGVFGPGVVESLCRSAALSRALVVDLDRQARSALLQLGHRTPCGFVFPIHELEAMPTEVAAQMIAAAAQDLGESRPWRAASHLALHRVLLPGATAAAMRLGSLCVERSGAHLRVGPAVLPRLRPRQLRAPERLELNEIGLRLEARCVARTSEWAVPSGTHHVAFDADRMPAHLTVRARRPGDRFAPFGESREHRLKSFLVDAGVPRWERDRVPLLEAAGHIAWVAGVRRGQIAAISTETARILEVTLNRL